MNLDILKNKIEAIINYEIERQRDDNNLNCCTYIYFSDYGITREDLERYCSIDYEYIVNQYQINEDPIIKNKKLYIDTMNNKKIKQKLNRIYNKKPFKKRLNIFNFNK